MGEKKSRYSDEYLYNMALRRVREKRQFLTHLISYVAVNIFLIGINLFTNQYYSYYWFLYVTLAWGIGLLAHGVKLYTVLNLDEEAVEKEVERIKAKQLRK